MNPPKQNSGLRKVSWIASAVLLVILVIVAPRILAVPPVEKRDVILLPFDTSPPEVSIEIDGVSVPSVAGMQVLAFDYETRQFGEFALMDLSNLRIAIQDVPRTQEAEGSVTIQARDNGSFGSTTTHHIGSTSGLDVSVLTVGGTTTVTWGPLEMEVVAGVLGIEGAGTWEIGGAKRVAFFDRHGTFLELVDVETWRAQDALTQDE